MLRAGRSYFVHFRYETDGGLTINVGKKNIGLNDLRKAIAERIKVPSVEVTNFILLDKRGLTDEERKRPEPADQVIPKGSGVGTPVGGSTPVRSGEGKS